MTRSPRRLLDLILVVGIVDFVLLLALLYVAWVDRSDGAVSVLGPIHGVGYLALLFLTVRGAAESFWGWWFPAIVLLTAGPIGSLVGEVLLRPRLRAQSSST